MMMDEQTTNSSYQHSTSSIEEQSSYRRYSTAETIPHSNSNDSQAEAAAAPSKRKCPWGKIIIATILIGIVTFVIIDSLTNQHISTGFQEFLTWIESNLVAGVFAFMGVYFIATVCFVPGSLLTLGSGFVFGSAVGVGYGVVLASLAVVTHSSVQRNQLHCWCNRNIRKGLLLSSDWYITWNHLVLLYWCKCRWFGGSGERSE